MELKGLWDYHYLFNCCGPVVNLTLLLWSGLELLLFFCMFCFGLEQLFISRLFILNDYLSMIRLIPSVQQVPHQFKSLF